MRRQRTRIITPASICSRIILVRNISREERVAMPIPAARYEAIAQLFCLNNLLVRKYIDNKLLCSYKVHGWTNILFVMRIPSYRYSGVWLITRCGSLSSSGYDIKHWGLCLAILFVYGFAFRCLAFFCLITVKTS